MTPSRSCRTARRTALGCHHRLLLAVTTLLMEVLGFQLAMLVFNVVLLVALGDRRWIVIALFAVAGSFGVYYVFTRWLDVLLPAGLLGL